MYRLDIATGQNSLLSSVVQSYVIASDNSLYGQNTDQSMWRYYDGALYEVDSAVAGYLVMPDSSAYYYKTNGGLWLQYSDGNYLPQLDPQTMSMQLTANGGIVALQKDGLLGSYLDGVFTSLDTGVEFYRAGADGTIYYEKQDGSFWSITATGTMTQLDNLYYSMYADETVYQLQNGFLESLGSDGLWRETADNIVQAVRGPDTQGVASTFWLTSDGQVDRANAGGFTPSFSTGISQLLVGPDDKGVPSTLALLSDGQVEAWNVNYNRLCHAGRHPSERSPAAVVRCSRGHTERYDLLVCYFGRPRPIHAYVRSHVLADSRQRSCHAGGQQRAIVRDRHRRQRLLLDRHALAFVLPISPNSLATWCHTAWQPMAPSTFSSRMAASVLPMATSL